MNIEQILLAPSLSHFMGTDELGRDLLWRILQGAGVSLGVAFIAVSLAVLIGLVLGVLSGYYGGWVDRAVMVVTDTLLCFPVFFLILAVVAVLGPNIVNVMAIIGATSWMGTARLVRAEVLSLKERPFIRSAKALGAGNGRILFFHVVPNVMSPVIVSAVFGFPSAILLESGLSFLGLGVQPPVPSWGNLLMDARSSLGAAWWPVFFPGLMIFLTVFGANALGMKLQKAFKP